MSDKLAKALNVMSEWKRSRAIAVIVIPLIEMCGCDWFKSRHVV